MTGSGKTHTMLGHRAEPGFTLLAARDLLKSGTVSVSVSYVQIYNSNVTDLLSDSNSGLRLRNDSVTGQIEVEGVTQVAVFSWDSVAELMRVGTKRRKVGNIVESPLIRWMITILDLFHPPPPPNARLLRIF